VRRTIASGPKRGLVERYRALGAPGLLGSLVLTLRTQAPCLTLLIALLGGLLGEEGHVPGLRIAKGPKEVKGAQGQGSLVPHVLAGHVDVGDTTTPRSPAGGAQQPAAALKRLQLGKQVQSSVPPRIAKPTILWGIAFPARRAPITPLRQEESPGFRPTARPRPVTGIPGPSQ
jgi:hypothetical protein